METVQPTLWQRLTGSIASVANTVKTAVTPKAAEPLVSDAATADAIGAAPELLAHYDRWSSSSHS